MLGNGDCGCPRCKGFIMSDPTFIATLINKLGVSSEDAKKAVDILSDTEIAKTNHAVTLTAGQHVNSLWMEGQLHKVPPANVLKIGPVQEASGGGGEKMVSDYSNTAPQMGLQMEAERLAAELGSMRAYAKSIAVAHDSLVDVVLKGSTQLGLMTEQVGNLTGVMSAFLAKAEDDEKKKEKDKDEEMHGDKACSLFAEAKKLLKKSKSIRQEAKTADPEKAKALKSAAKAFRKASARCIKQAQTEALAGRGTNIDFTFETRKAINVFLDQNPSIKADMKVMHEDEEEDDEKKKAKKAYKKAKAPVVSGEDPAAKAIVGHSDAKGNQKDGQDGETKNQDDSAVKALQAKAEDIEAKVDNALNGLGLLKTDVKGFFDVLSAKPATAPLTPVMNLVKSGEKDTPMEAAARRINLAEEDDMDMPLIMKARHLLTRLDGVTQGVIEKGVFEAELNNAPAAVRELFTPAA